MREVAPSGSGQRVGRGPWATAPRELWRPEASPRQQRAAWQIPCSLGRAPRALTAASTGRDSNPARLCRLLRAGGQEGRQRAAHWPLGSRIRVARWPWAKKGSSSTEQAIGENPRVWPLMVVDSPGEVAGLPGRMGYHEAGWSPPELPGFPSAPPRPSRCAARTWAWWRLGDGLCAALLRHLSPQRRVVFSSA